MQVFEKMTYKHSACVCVRVHTCATHIEVNVFITAGRTEIMNLFHSGIPLKKKKLLFVRKGTEIFL